MARYAYFPGYWHAPRQSSHLFLRALTPLGVDPRRPGTDIRGLAGHDDLYRLRVGDFRVIYQVRDGELIIPVVGVGHRREIYLKMT